MHGENQYACMLLMGKYERKGPLERPIHRWDDNVKIDHEELG